APLQDAPETMPLPQIMIRNKITVAVRMKRLLPAALAAPELIEKRSGVPRKRALDANLRIAPAFRTKMFQRAFTMDIETAQPAGSVVNHKQLAVIAPIDAQQA